MTERTVVLYDIGARESRKGFTIRTSGIRGSSRGCSVSWMSLPYTSIRNMVLAVEDEVMAWQGSIGGFIKFRSKRLKRKYK